MPENFLNSPEKTKSLLVLLAGATAMTLANLGAWSMPLLTGTLIDRFGFSELDAGILISVEMLAMATASLLTALLLPRLTPRLIAIVGVLIAASGHAATAEFQSLFSMGMCRAVSGFGEGMLYASGCATIARLGNADRAFAIAMIIQGLVAALMLSVLPIGLEIYHDKGLFLSLALFTLLLSPLLVSMPGKRKAAELAQEVESTGTYSVPSYLGFLLMAAMLFIAIMEISMWQNIERLAIRLQMTNQSIGYALSASTIIGTMGGLTAAALETRIGRVIPISAGLIVQFVSAAICIFAQSPQLYLLGFMCWSFALFFLYPYLFGTASTFDSMGRWAAAASGILVSGQIIGPILSAYFVEGGAYQNLFVIILIFTTLSLIFFIPIFKASVEEIKKKAERVS